MISRNGFNTEGLMVSEVVTIDTVYEIADAELNSRQDVHQSFAGAKGEKSWARHYLKYEVDKIALREGFILSWHGAMTVARKIANDWFLQRATEAQSN